MMTVGPWKDLRLQMYDYRIDDVRVDYDFVGDDYDTVNMRIRGEVVSASEKYGGGLEWKLQDGQGRIVGEGAASITGSAFDVTAKVGGISAWYPKGYGDQAMYTLHLHLSDVSVPDPASALSET